MKNAICVAVILTILALCSLPLAAQTANPTLTLNQAIALHCSGAVEAAMAKYEQVAATSQDSTEIRHARFAIGACLFSLKHYSAAVTAFMQFDSDFPDDFQAPFAIAMAGDCFAEQGLIAQAAPYYGAALAIHQSPENEHVWRCHAALGEGKVLFSRGDYANAVTYLSQAVSTASEQKVLDEASALLKACSDSLAQTGQPASAGAVLGRAALVLGKMYADERLYDSALTYLQLSETKAGDGDIIAESTLAAGNVLLMRLHTDEALAAARSVAQIPQQVFASSTTMPSWAFKAKSLEANVLLRSGHYSEAAQACDDAITLNPGADAGDIREVKQVKANALLVGGRLSEALAVIKALRDENVSGGFNLAMDTLVGDYYVGAERYSEGIQVYLRLIAQIAAQEGNAEADAGLRYKLGYCYHSTGDDVTAKQYLRQVIVSPTTNSWITPAQTALNTWFGN